MKNRLLLVVMLGLPIALFLFFWRHTAPTRTPDGRAQKLTQDAAVAKALASASPQVNAIIASNFAVVKLPQNPVFTAPAKNYAAAGAPALLGFTNFSASTVLENVRHALRDFGARFGGNPVGTNPEITRALSGDNPGQVNFLSADAGLRVNGNGELIDPWGTPYFFHQLSGTETEIHSAGPDQIMWTQDDLVLK